jgi:serine/threonine protein kinase
VTDEAIDADVAEGPPPRGRGREVAPGYRLMGLLNRSRHLDVHDAWSEERATRCVIKLARPDRVGDAKVARRLRAESRLLQRFSHPHIVRAYPAPGATEALVVTETLTGSTLGHLLATTPRRLGAAEIAHLGMHLGAAISYLHRHGWLHLDLKPGNIVAEAGRAKVIDLSIARRPGRVRAGVGTFHYMAPEQARGGVVGPAADIWGLGVVLHEAAAGEPAFDDPTVDDPDGGSGSTGGGSGYASSVADGSATDDTPPPQLGEPAAPRRRRRRGLPADLTALVDACLDRDPARRPEVGTVLRTLERVAGVPEVHRLHGPLGPSGARPA